MSPAGDVAGVTRVWNLRTGAAVEVRGHEGTVASLAFSPDGASLVTASEDETAAIWDARTGTSIAALRGHRGLVLGAAFVPDGRAVVTGSTDGMIRTWAVASDPVQAVLVAPTTEDPARRRLCPRRQAARDGERGLHGERVGRGGRRVVNVLPHGDGRDEWVESARFSGDGQAGAHRGGRWDGQGLAGRLRGSDRNPWDGRRAGAPRRSRSRADSRLVAAGGLDDEIRIWRWRAAEADPPAGRVLEGGRRRVRPRRLSPRRRRRRHAPRLARRRRRTGRVGVDGEGQQYALTSVAFDPGGRSSPQAARAAQSGSGIGAARSVWRASRATATPSRTSRSTRPAATSWRSLAHRGTANVWSVPRGQLVTALRTRASSLEGATFAPSGRRLAVAGAGGRVTVFECAECRPLSSLVCLAARRVTPPVRAA